ncbi:hypothetical protein NDK47_23040 [Brevibacillus ruminantium]|uniref:Lipoprotein n=1 Tax=Brevibacillus ruminantium TaxID=2950604 RepID=A0ABY4WI00_9BACL|nr:hypothetical protein [Brevibacillus ruminantium]USG64969.1 hypothetical protein NDK47_23040 [Brevibacillus ruminantium]
MYRKKEMLLAGVIFATIVFLSGCMANPIETSESAVSKNNQKIQTEHAKDLLADTYRVDEEARKIFYYLKKGQHEKISVDFQLVDGRLLFKDVAQGMEFRPAVLESENPLALNLIHYTDEEGRQIEVFYQVYDLEKQLRNRFALQFNKVEDQWKFVSIYEVDE